MRKLKSAMAMVVAPLASLVVAGCATTSVEATTTYQASGQAAERRAFDPASCNSRNSRAHSRCAFHANYDTDGDGHVSVSEFEAERSVSFDAKDMDGDGVVVAAEYVAEYEERLDRQLAAQREAAIEQTYVRFNALDRDDDEEMTEEEFNASGMRTFNRYDVNGDGRVDENDPMPESWRRRHDN